MNHAPPPGPSQPRAFVPPAPWGNRALEGVAGTLAVVGVVSATVGCAALEFLGSNPDAVQFAAGGAAAAVPFLALSCIIGHVASKRRIDAVLRAMQPPEAERPVRHADSPGAWTMMCTQPFIERQHPPMLADAGSARTGGGAR